MTCGFLNMKAADFSSWEAVYTALLTVVSNPYFIVSIVIYVVGCFTDTSTPGYADSAATMAKTSLQDKAVAVVHDGEDTAEVVDPQTVAETVTDSAPAETDSAPADDAAKAE